MLTHKIGRICKFKRKRIADWVKSGYAGVTADN